MNPPPDGDVDRFNEEDITNRVLGATARSGTPTVAVWEPNATVSFGPRDVTHSGYDQAVATARAKGYDISHRRMGGRPVAMHDGCLAFVYGMPREGSIESRYESVITMVAATVESMGVRVRQTAVHASFCPGQHSLVGAGKIAGFAQRVRDDAVAVGGIIIVRGHDRLTALLSPIYDALDLSFDQTTVSSLNDSGANCTPAEFHSALECQFSRHATTAL